jgi:UDP-N-acetylmuramate--alanine ligase
MTDKVLRDAKIKVISPFNPKNISPSAATIVYSIAYNENNKTELAYIKTNPEIFGSVKLISYAEALGEVFNQYFGIAVCGSHGKTTTSAWLGYVLLNSGLRPNVLVGSRVPQFKGSSLQGAGKYFIAEADEYWNKLQYFNPYGVVLNNIDYDHPDFFKTPADYVKVFRDFVKRIPANGFLVLNNSDSESRKLKKIVKAKIITYDLDDGGSGSVSTVNYLAYGRKLRGAKQTFQVNNLGEFKISLSGRHNIYNALAVIAAARELKVPLAKIKKHLASFSGTERRAQILGKYRGALIIDDYAHHPTEVKATLNGLRAGYPQKNIITVFHPHTFTRTKALFNDFVTSFKDSNELIILDIYGSARESASWRKSGISSAKLVQEITKFNKKNKIKQSVANIKTIPGVVAYLKKKARPDDLIVLMGAGDVFRVAAGLLPQK